MWEKWAQLIRMAVIVKDPEPRTPADREILKREINDENKEIDEYRKTVDELKLKNLDVFRKIENNSMQIEEARNHEISKTRPTNLDETDARLLGEVQHGFSWQGGLEKSKDHILSGKEKSQQLVNKKFERVLKCTY